jgi:dTDP-4-dehydrorhamnose reductase
MDEYAPMRVFVTGLGGYLGRAIAALEPDAIGITGRAQADVRDEDAMCAALDATEPDAVIHTAYLQGGPDARSTNVDGSAVVARAAKARGLRLVHMSSDVVFSGVLGRPLREEDEVDPITDYGRTKADAEIAVAAAHGGAVLVRTSLIYGGAEPSRQELLAVDPSVSFYVDELRCPIAAPDLAAAVLELAGRPEVRGPLHVAGADAVSRFEFAELVAHRQVAGVARPPDRPGDLRLDCSSAYAFLRTRVRGVHEVLG